MNAHPQDVETASTGRRDSRELAADSRTVAFWTLVSRLTGFLRVAALAAVLGPTFFGNLFQTILLIPYLLCELMAGSLITAMLPPHLVSALDRGGAREASAVARGFLGVLLPAFAIAGLLLAIFSPLLLSLLTFAVDDPAVRERQVALGVPLLLLVLPQVVLYAVVAVGISVQHARRRFAFATAAPLIENLGLIVILGLSAVMFGIGLDVEQITVAQLLMLGLGSTVAVALHAAAQWWGAYRLGVSLIPTAGWRDSAVRQIIRIAIPSCGSAGLNSIGLFALLVAAGHIPGGAIAFQIGMNFYNLPIALCAFPLAFAQSPLLSRHFARADLKTFSSTYYASLRLTLFVALPACAAFLGMSDAIAAAVSFGGMADAFAMSLIAAVLAGLSFGIVGEAVFVVERSSAYARLDALVTFRAMVIRIALILGGIAFAFSVDGAGAQLFRLGLVYSAAAMAAAGYMHWKARDVLDRPNAAHSIYWLVANCVIAAAATLPATLISSALSLEDAPFYERILSAAAVLLLAASLYLLLQFARRAPELDALFSFARARPPGAANAVTRSGGASPDGAA